MPPFDILKFVKDETIKELTSGTYGHNFRTLEEGWEDDEGVTRGWEDSDTTYSELPDSSSQKNVLERNWERQTLKYLNESIDETIALGEEFDWRKVSDYEKALYARQIAGIGSWNKDSPNFAFDLSDPNKPIFKGDFPEKYGNTPEEWEADYWDVNPSVFGSGQSTTSTTAVDSSLTTLSALSGTKVFDVNLDKQFSSILDSIYGTEKVDTTAVDTSGGDFSKLGAAAKQLQATKGNVTADTTDAEVIDQLGALSDRFMENLSALENTQDTGEIDEKYVRLQKLGNLIFNQETSDYWLDNNEATIGQGEWKTRTTDPSAGEVMIQMESAKAGSPMVTSNILADQFSKNPISIIENYARLSDLPGAEQALNFITAYDDITNMLSADPNAFTQYNPIMNALHFWGSDRMTVPGMEGEVGELFDKPFGMSQILEGSADMTSASMWKGLDDYIKEHPGEDGEIVRNYKEQLINALPFFEQVKNQFTLDSIEYDQLEEMFKPDTEDPDVKAWQDLKASTNQDYQLLLDQGIIDKEGQLINKE